MEKLRTLSQIINFLWIKESIRNLKKSKEYLQTLKKYVDKAPSLEQLRHDYEKSRPWNKNRAEAIKDIIEKFKNQ